MEHDTVENDADGDTVTLTLEILEEFNSEVLVTDAEAPRVLHRKDLLISPLPRMARITMPRRVARDAGWIE